MIVSRETPFPRTNLGACTEAVNCSLWLLSELRQDNENQAGRVQDSLNGSQSVEEIHLWKAPTREIESVLALSN